MARMRRSQFTEQTYSLNLPPSENLSCSDTEWELHHCRYSISDPPVRNARSHDEWTHRSPLLQIVIENFQLQRATLRSKEASLQSTINTRIETLISCRTCKSTQQDEGSFLFGSVWLEFCLLSDLAGQDRLFGMQWISFCMWENRHCTNLPF